MAVSILKDMCVTVINSNVTAGTSAINSSVILDMQGYDSVCMFAQLGTVTSTCVLTLNINSNTTSSTSGATLETGATCTVTDAGGNTSGDVLLVDLFRPSKRYVYANLTRTTANAVINSIIAIQYNTKNYAATQPASVVASAFAGPNG